MDTMYFKSINSSLKEEMTLVECRLPITNKEEIDVVTKNVKKFDRCLLGIKNATMLLYKCFYFYMYPMTVYFYIDILD